MFEALILSAAISCNNANQYSANVERRSRVVRVERQGIGRARLVRRFFQRARLVRADRVRVFRQRTFAAGCVGGG